MTRSSFDEFVKREAEAKRSEEKVDWAKEREKWLSDLSSLYASVRSFLKPYIDQGQVQVDQSATVSITEEHIGQYQAPQMVISIGRKQVVLRPVGTLLIGSRGRVDVLGPFGQGTLILLSDRIKQLSDMIHVSVNTSGKLATPKPDKEANRINWVWRILGRPPERKIAEFTRENFLDMLTEISNG